MDRGTARILLHDSVLAYGCPWAEAVDLAIDGLAALTAIDFAIEQLEKEVPPSAQYSRNDVLRLLKDLIGE